MLGGDFAGIITAVGKAVSGCAVGDCVVGFAAGTLASSITVKKEQFVKMPMGLSFAEAAAIPAVYMTVFYCLHDLVKLKAKERILIHAATGGVGLAAIAYARSVGAEVYATAGSEKKRAYLRELGIQYIYDSRSTTFAEKIQEDTGGQGIHVVLNSLTGPGFIEASLQSCVRKARFVEIAKRDIWTVEQVHAAREDIAYHVVALDKEIAKRPKWGYALLTRVLKWLQQHRIQPMPIQTFPMHQAVMALKRLQQAQHIGKIVVTREETAVSRAGVYLITGGLSGIGYALCGWLVRQGVQQIAILSRREASDEQNKQFLDWGNQGTVVKSYAVDVSDAVALAEVYRQIQREQGLVKHVIHSAGVLSDATILNQTPESYHRVYQAKVYGAWNLHELTREDELEHFIVFASMAGILGNPGQSNHAAANVFLDALIHQRRLMGLKGLSIDWGAWGETGSAIDMFNAIFECIF